MAGDWEGCARGYIEAYLRSDRNWPLQYNCLSGFASVLREGNIPVSEYNSVILQQLSEDKSAPTIHRIQASARNAPLKCPARFAANYGAFLRAAQAHFSLGYLAHSAGDDQAAAHGYGTAMTLASSQSA